VGDALGKQEWTSNRKLLMKLRMLPMTQTLVEDVQKDLRFIINGTPPHWSRDRESESESEGE
jgi:hypothetical protein